MSDFTMKNRMPLQPDEARKILQAIPMDRMEGAKDFALLLTALATGKRMHQVLGMRWEQMESLPDPVQQVVRDYLERVGLMEWVQPDGYIFPLLVQALGGHCFLQSWQIILLKLRGYAESAGLDTRRIHQGSWRQAAAVIHQQPGGFDAFLAQLGLPNQFR